LQQQQAQSSQPGQAGQQQLVFAFVLSVLWLMLFVAYTDAPASIIAATTLMIVFFIFTLN
jgi:hypothetical protein